MQAKSYICDLTPYQVSIPPEEVARRHGIAPEDIVQLASNENPLGCSPYAKEAIQRIVHGVHRYPDQYELTRTLAEYVGASSDMIALGSGSNDILDLIARVYLGEDDQAISSQYSFSVYQIATRTAGAENVVMSAREFGLDLQAMFAAITARTKVIWLDNPGNPTGTFVSPHEVKQFLEQVPSRIMVVYDEAYREYLAPESQANVLGWLHKHPNLIVVRTFSKMYGLAGLRVGYAIAQPEVIAHLNRVRLPFNVNVASLTAALAAIKDTEFVCESYEVNRAGIAQLLRGLEELGYESIPAHGNFIAINVGNASHFAEMLMRRGVVVRPLSGYGLPQYVRVTIGTRNQNDRLLDALIAAQKVAM